MSIDSEHVNFLVYRYLQESGAWDFECVLNSLTVFLYDFLYGLRFSLISKGFNTAPSRLPKRAVSRSVASQQRRFLRDHWLRTCNELLTMFRQKLISLKYVSKPTKFSRLGRVTCRYWRSWDNWVFNINRICSTRSLRAKTTTIEGPVKGKSQNRESFKRGVGGWTRAW